MEDARNRHAGRSGTSSRASMIAALEAIDAGVVLVCRARRSLATRTKLDERALAALAGDCDASEVRARLRTRPSRRPSGRRGRSPSCPVRAIRLAHCAATSPVHTT